MNKKIIFIILGALALLVLMFFLWFWFFGRGTGNELPNNGSLGSADTSGNTGAAGTTGGNNQASIDANTGSSNTAGTGGTGGGDYIPSYTLTTGSSTLSYSSPTGVIWLDGSGGGGGGGGSTNNRFVPTPINQLNRIDISGIGNIGSTDRGTGGGAVPIIGVGIAGVLACTPGLLVGATSALGGFFTGIPVNSVAQNVVGGNEVQKQFLDCIARTIAKVALQQITASVVDWINSGFNGQPSFVQDYNQFFNDVADKAAGEFISGSSLAFLCSPFQLQVKIAIAQSYANRKSSNASSCTLSSVTDNVDNFFKGSFSTNGGWPGFLEVTTNPNNNPYGAFITGQVSLGSYVSKQVNLAGLNVSPEGYVGTTEEYDCHTVTKDPVDGPVRECKTRIITTGHTIAHAVDKNLDLPIDENLLADSFDEIISALMNQLLTKALYSGVSNLSASTDTGQQRGIDAAQTLLTNLQGASQLAQQYGSAEQGSVGDIQVAQSQLTGLANCWATAASSTALSASQVSQAQAQAAIANTTITNLEARVTLFNNNITKANAAVTAIEQLQTSALSATTLAQVQAVQARFTAAQSAGTIITQAAVTSAQQDRQTLQSEMTGVNQNTATQLTQCYAFGH